MTLTEIPSEDLEGQLLRHIDTIMREVQYGQEFTHVNACWMQEAVKELQLRRLARSAG